MQDWLRHLLAPRMSERVSGAPASANGASTFLLWWQLPYGTRLTALSVTLEVTMKPTLDHLVAFAMQGVFTKPGGGSCYLGLQHHPQFPDSGAVNWGGHNADGNSLDGSSSLLPSALDDVTTRDFAWREGTPYQLSIERGEEQLDGSFLWTGSVTDLRVGERTVIREIVSDSPHLRAPVMYVEAFSPCDAPRFQAEWSNATAVSSGGDEHAVRSMRVDYLPYAAGGCTNTDVFVKNSVFVQATGRMRTAKPGTMLRLD